jgi:hypothetical protein
VKKKIHRFPFCLHMQHLSIKITCLFRRLSIVRILPIAADHAKKNLPWRSLSLPYTLPRKVTPHRASKRAKERLDREQAFFGGDRLQPIFTTSLDIDWVQHLEKRSKNIHSPVMRFSRKAHAPLKKITQELQIIRNRSILRTHLNCWYMLETMSVPISRKWFICLMNFRFKLM